MMYSNFLNKPLFWGLPTDYTCTCSSFVGFHPRLSEITAHYLSQEVNGHTLKPSLLISQHLSECRMGPQFIKGLDPSCTKIWDPSCIHPTYRDPVGTGVFSIFKSKCLVDLHQLALQHFFFLGTSSNG